MRSRSQLLIVILSIAASYALFSAALGAADAQSTTQPVWQYNAGDGVVCVAVSGDGGYIAAGSYDGSVYLFDGSGSLLWKRSVVDTPWSVAISADGQYVAAGSNNSKVYLFDRTGRKLWENHVGDTPWSVAISADGQYVAAGSNNSKVYLFDRSGYEVWRYSAGSWINSVAISADGQSIVAGSGDGNAYAFSHAGDKLWQYRASGSVYSVAISADGQYVAAGDVYGNVYELDRAGARRWQYSVGDGVYSVAISADGQYVAAGSRDTKGYLFDGTGKMLYQYSTGGAVYSVAISADGQYVAVGSRDASAYLFDRYSSGKWWQYATGGIVNSVAISADGQSIVAGSSDGGVYALSNPANAACGICLIGSFLGFGLTLVIGALIVVLLIVAAYLLLFRRKKILPPSIRIHLGKAKELEDAMATITVDAPGPHDSLGGVVRLSGKEIKTFDRPGEMLLHLGRLAPGTYDLNVECTVRSGPARATGKAFERFEVAPAAPASVQEQGAACAPMDEIEAVHGKRDVFISYSAQDKPIADAVCHGMEAQKIKCWIAPRDVLPGMDFEKAIIEAICNTRVLVVVYSSHSNSSKHVVNEIRAAWSKGIPIIPFKIEDVPMNEVMSYYMSSTHWLDAMTPPLEKHIGDLSRTVKFLFGEKKG